ncbi:unnamed protein product, partial [Iphiclides podalirius]
MKINEKNLCAFASSATPVDREGWLDMRAEVGKSYQRRWFTLKGNLLFYFDKKADKEPVGVIILEGCTIELTEEESYSFKIVFQCEANGAELQRQLDEVQAEEAADVAALVTISPPETEPKVPPRGQRYNPFNRVPDGEGQSKTVPGSRHHKENVRTDMPRKKVPFRDIHTAHGRKILAHRSEWRARLRTPQRPPEKPLIQL